MVLHLFNPDGTLNDEAVQDAVKTLKDGTLDDKEKAAKALDRMLQMHEQQRASTPVVVVKRGVILPCVQLLKDGTPGGQMHAAGILACVAETPVGVFATTSAVAAASPSTRPRSCRRAASSRSSTC